MRRLVIGLGMVAMGCSPRVFGGGEPGVEPPPPAPAPPAPTPAPPPTQQIAATPPPPAPACAAPIVAGDRVICNWMGRGVYYPGRVVHGDGLGGLSIQYDDGDREQTDAARCLHEPAGAHHTPQAIAAPDPDGIAGRYEITAASNPGGGSYTGSVAVTRGGDVYHFAWTIAGSPGYAGVALHVGNVLGVGWSTGGAPGVVVYKVDGGKLDGKWASGSGNGVGTEVLAGPPGLSGTYKITTGKNPDGSSYTGSVKITHKGKIYQLAWSIPGTSYAGVGILKDKVLSVGWGQGTAPGVVAYGVSGQTLDGVWANPSDTRLGKERLERKK